MTRIRVLHHPESGYEQAGGDWPWVMVPQGECRSLLLDIDKTQPVKLGNLDQDGFAGNRLNSFLQAKLIGNELRICGLPSVLNTQDVAVDVYQPDRRLRVWVSVKRRRKVLIAAHYVEHGPLLRTRTTRAQLREMIEAANKILLPQTNFYLSLATESVLSYERIGKRLGLNVSRQEGFNDLAPHALEITAGPQDLRPLNLFLVREIQGSAAGRCYIDFAFALVEDSMFLGKYYLSFAGEVLAHEVGHHLGLPHNPTTGYLMHVNDGGHDRGIRLYRMEIEKMCGAGFRPSSEPLLTHPFR